MDFPEMIFLIAVTVILPISVLYLLFSYQTARIKAKKAGVSENELTTSELEHMIEEAVTDATAELQERVDLLESQLRLLNPSREGEESRQIEGSKTMGSVTKE
jgi:hypothetical protein